MALSVENATKIFDYRKSVILQFMATTMNDNTTATVGILTASLDAMQISKPQPGSLAQILNIQV